MKPPNRKPKTQKRKSAPKRNPKTQKSIRYAQNFLVDKHLVKKLVNQSGVSESDLVLEIGAGRGIITEALARSAKDVIAYEKDKTLITMLSKRLAKYTNVSVRKGDFLSFTLPKKQYKIFANPPFNISTNIIVHLLSSRNAPEEAYLILQREFVQRLKSSRKEHLFNLMYRPWFNFKVVHSFQQSDFSPRPSITPVLLRIKKLEKPKLEASEIPNYTRFLKKVFSAPHSSMRKNLMTCYTPGQLKVMCKKGRVSLDSDTGDWTHNEWVALYHAGLEFKPQKKSRGRS